MSVRQFSLDAPETWPSALLATLEANHDVLLDWETKKYSFSARRFDDAVIHLSQSLKAYSIIRWHCTRLTDGEIANILATGIQLPNSNTLDNRINCVVEAGKLAPATAALLKSKNQALDSNRAGKLWFCFYPPSYAGERGIGRFFRHWGGEALYNSHEDDPVTSQALRIIGTPCVLVTSVPIVLLGSPFGLVQDVGRRYLRHCGYNVLPSGRQEAYVVHDLPASKIVNIVQYPTETFMALTGCASWLERIE
jgi:hypothetical protein